jgi:Lipopolysaccharide-assembly
MQLRNRILSLGIGLAFLLLTGASSCSYTFADVSIPPQIKTVKIIPFDNRAPYVNTQLSPTLTNRFQQKVVGQTKLTQTNNDADAHYLINGTITNYSISTSGISTNNNNQRQASMNNLTVAVHITLYNQLANTTQEFDVSRSFPFDARLSLQAAESQLLDEMVRNLTDDIFNRIFSDW